MEHVSLPSLYHWEVREPWVDLGYLVTHGAGAVCSPWRHGQPYPIFWLCLFCLLKTGDKSFRRSVTALRMYNFLSALTPWTPLVMKTDLSPDSVQTKVVSAISKLKIGNIAERCEKTTTYCQFFPFPCPFVFPFSVKVRFFKKKFLRNR